MANRRILSLWFPRMAAERVLRQRRDTLPVPFAIVAERNGAQVLASLNPEAEAAGLRQDQPLRDATAMCPALATRGASPSAEAQFLTALRRWAGKFSPWVAEEPPESLVIDLTGCAHLFGGEAGLLEVIEADCADLGLTVRAGIADTRGAAWALARFAGQVSGPSRNGDAIDQEARATRARAAKRRGWERGGRPPSLPAAATPQGVIAPPGGAREAISPLPLAALRLTQEVIDGLHSLGLRRVSEVLELPRAPFARRFGAPALRRLDQALGIEPEPVAPAGAPLHFAARLTFPDPIGLREDIEAGVERLLPPLCARLAEKGRGARWVRLQAFRSDGEVIVVEVGLARAVDQPDRIKPLLWLKLDRIDPGFGIDCLRLEASATEPLHATQHAGHIVAAQNASGRSQSDTTLEDLIGKLGARLGEESVIRLHPGASHVPEKSVIYLAAAWSEPYAETWPPPTAHRPLLMFQPESIGAPETVPAPPADFRWRNRKMTTRMAIGPERLLPEWWFDDPEWRSGPRDYWRLETAEGDRLWVFFAHGKEVTGGWFCDGRFA